MFGRLCIERYCVQSVIQGVEVKNCYSKLNMHDQKSLEYFSVLAMPMLFL